MSIPKRNPPCDECLVFPCCKGRYERYIESHIRKHKATQTMVLRCSILHDYCKEAFNDIKQSFKERGLKTPAILIEHPFEISNETTKNWITFPFNL